MSADPVSGCAPLSAVPLAGLVVGVTGCQSLASSWAAQLLADAGATLALDPDDAAIWILGEGAATPPAGVAVRIPLTADGGFADEGAAAALTGLWEAPIGGRIRPIPVPVASAIAGTTAATAALAAHLAGRRTVEVPLADAALSALELTALLTDAPPTAWSPLRWAASPLIGAYRASDGWIYLHAGLAGHLARLEPLLPAPLALSAATRRDPASPGSPGEAVRLHRQLAAAFATRPASEWEERLGGAGLCCVRVRDDWRADPLAHAFGHGDTSAPTPVFTDLRSRPPLPAPGPLPLSGVRVLDWTQVIAGPSAARALAELGADVVRVENPHQDAGWADAFHAAFSPGKRLVHHDARTPEGAAAIRELVAGWRPHVVVDGLRRGVTERLLGPGWAGDAVRVRISAYGPGPWAGRPGWEQTVQALVGLQLAYGGRAPELVPVPVTDLGTGLIAAFGAVASLVACREGRPAPDVEASLQATATRLMAMPITGTTAPGTRRSTAIATSPLRIRGACTRIGGIVRLDGARLPDLPDAEARRPPGRGPARVRWWLQQAGWALAVARNRAAR